MNAITPASRIPSPPAFSPAGQELLKPRALKRGDAVGIFTPSFPAHVHLREKYLHGLSQLEQAGFPCIEGSLTARMGSEGYRSAPPQERAEEFMGLIRHPDVKCLMAAIGGSNSASMIPYLDFAEIRRSRKLICGYSDVTSLHLAIFAYSHLSTLYGPAVVPTFGEYPSVFEDSLRSFLTLAQGTGSSRRPLAPPAQWSREFIDASKPGWKDVRRTYAPNSGWIGLSSGSSTAPLIAGNLETLLTAAGTPYFPFLRDRILAIEETAAMFSRTECNYRHLEQMGVFEDIAGLIISKPGDLDPEGAPFSHQELIQEIIGKRPYPIVYNFDCGHTFPMITLGQGMLVSLHAAPGGACSIALEEQAVDNA